MILHTEKGKSGEEMAATYLIEKKFSIISCNWRFGHYEIDIIAKKNDVIHFIEVKTRHSNNFGYPEESVNHKKFRNLQKAATAYLKKFNKVMKIQFDILSIRILPGKEIEYFFIEDFYLY
jgi:putative endonuclease